MKIIARNQCDLPSAVTLAVCACGARSFSEVKARK